MRRLLGLSHQTLRAASDTFLKEHDREKLRAGLERLSGESYGRMAKEYLAVLGPEDPRYDDLLRGAFLPVASPDYSILYAALFTRNEQEYGTRYSDILARFLTNLSEGYVEQRALVSGHIVCRNGYTLVNDQHLRIASGPHARPRRSACYLLIDCAGRAESARGLLAGLHGF
jgi:hypothetical protein